MELLPGNILTTHQHHRKMLLIIIYSLDVKHTHGSFFKLSAQLILVLAAFSWSGNWQLVDSPLRQCQCVELQEKFSVVKNTKIYQTTYQSLSWLSTSSEPATRTQIPPKKSLKFWKTCWSGSDRNVSCVVKCVSIMIFWDAWDCLIAADTLDTSAFSAGQWSFQWNVEKSKQSPRF